MSDTPRTDALKHSIERPNTGYRCLRKNERTDDVSDALNLCCQLERDIAAARASERERCAACCNDWGWPTVGEAIRALAAKEVK